MASNCMIQKAARLLTRKGSRTRLHNAVVEENVQDISNLINNGLDVNATDVHGMTPLHLAVETRNLTILKLLVDAGAKIGDNNDILYKAIKSNNVDILKLIISTGANLNKKDKVLRTPLHQAAEWGNSKVLKLLIDSGANVNADSDLPLLLAVQSNNLNTIKLLIHSGANVNSKSIVNTPLQMAVRLNNLAATKLLIDSGADVNIVDKYNDTLLHQAARLNSVDVVKFLVDLGANVHSKNGKNNTPLHLAAESNSSGAVRLLIEAGANVHAENSNKKTPLLLACDKLDFEKSFNYSDSGSNSDSDYDNDDDVHEESSNSNLQVEIVTTWKLLIDAGAKVNVRNSQGKPPLIIAIQLKNLKLTELLIDVGADVNSKDYYGSTAIHEAVKLDDTRIMQLLIDAGADLNKQDYDGNCLLHKVAYPSVDRLKILMFAGADCNTLNENSVTPLGYFINKSFGLTEKKAVLKLLIEYTDVNLLGLSGENVLHQILSSLRTQKYVYVILLEHIAKIKALGLPLDTSLVETISLYVHYDKYFSECTLELEKAKKTKLENCWVTFFNILVDDEAKLVKYAGNKDLAVDLKKKAKQFPIYGPIVRSKMSKAANSRIFFDKAVNILSDYLPIFNPTHLIIRDILYALNKNDWSSLCINKRFREE